MGPAENVSGSNLVFNGDRRNDLANEVGNNPMMTGEVFEDRVRLLHSGGNVPLIEGRPSGWANERRR